MPAPETAAARETAAVIDIGSGAVRMVLAELGPGAAIRALENLSQPVRLGRDVFTNGRISAPVMRETIEILRNFKTVLETYGVKRLHAIATSAVREAANRDNFIDKIFLAAGIDVEVVEGTEENRLDLLAVENSLEGSLQIQKKNCLIMEVGCGATEIIVLSKGKVDLTRTLLIGSIRLPERLAPGRSESGVMQRVVKRAVHTMAEDARREYNLDEVDTFIAMGSDMRLAARQIAGPAEQNHYQIAAKDFLDFSKSLAKVPPEELAAQYAIPFADAETLYPATLIYSCFISETKVESLVVPTVSIRDGLLLEMSQMVSGAKRTDVSRQVTNSARSLGRKYKYDEPHALNVAALSGRLFDALKGEHGLGPRERMLLEASALLHDIGIYISPTSHHKHSAYLVNASEIFGLRKSDKDIVSNVVRYHRRSLPKPTHTAYMSLPRPDRTVVSKLSAILRVADALDNPHQQKVRDFDLEKQPESYTIWVGPESGDVSLERQSVQAKGDMFLEVFGAGVALKQRAA
ncbi:MAG TPA: phosphatase [Elusimicrobia bacterium]|nr:phosphatase [Elusimicrobiota bacterium]HBT61630.1 phosphatase [Elusimicrobiota bacterium]